MTSSHKEEYPEHYEESSESWAKQVMRNAYMAFKRGGIARNLAIILTIASVFSGIATYVTITNSSKDLGPDPSRVIGWAVVDLILLLSLAVIIVWKTTKLWIARRRGSVGSRLQTRIIIMFSLVSIIPTIIVAIFSSMFFNYGIQAWFDKRVGTALEASVAVAEGYMTEHKENIRADILAMANDLNNQAGLLIKNPSRFKQVVTAQAALRSLTEAIVFQHSNVLARTGLSFSLLFEVEELPPDVLERAEEGEVVVLTSDNDDRVRALIKLNSFFDTYLLVGRFVDSKVLSHIEQTKGSVNEYLRLKSNISRLQIEFSFVFIAVAMLLLFATIWVGMIFAGELVEPVISLISATERLKAGDLNIRVKEGPRNDEIGTLGRGFNRMTDQLQKQRAELVEVNRQINERRRFTEAVLSGVSAGVVALNSNKVITLFNRSAINLLSASSEELSNKLFIDAFPEVKDLMLQAEKTPYAVVQDEINIKRKRRKAMFLVRIVTEEFSDEIEGYVVTFDDITDLLAAQRSAAWADVARRIAHEIKNPLTPIHLSAERLRQKYFKDIDKKDQEAFTKYIDTIVRHVGNMGRIVEEFANFARMPSPNLSRQNLCEIVKDAVFSEEVVHPDISYDLNLPEDIFVNCDRNQIVQVLINILKNAGEAVAGNKSSKGKISIAAILDDYINLEIKDNGIGFPTELLDRITEPYVTTREKGTGLGLAIVKKVMSDHEGKISVSNIIDKMGNIKGANVTLSFPRV